MSRSSTHASSGPPSDRAARRRRRTARGVSDQRARAARARRSPASSEQPRDRGPVVGTGGLLVRRGRGLGGGAGRSGPGCPRSVGLVVGSRLGEVIGLGGVAGHGLGPAARGGLEAHPAGTRRGRARARRAGRGRCRRRCRARPASGLRKPTATRAGMPRIRAITAIDGGELLAVAGAAARSLAQERQQVVGAVLALGAVVVGEAAVLAGTSSAARRPSRTGTARPR